jgi:diguanylate cyclase (GGDEF)-like protein
VKKAPLPQDEAARLAAVRSLRILDTPAEERFDRVTRVAQRVFGVPISMVTLVDSDRQWFKSRQGITVSEAPRDFSFCAHTILSDRTLVVPDARNDERFFDHPWVAGPPHIRFYAGHPLKSREGFRIGTLAIADVSRREMSDDDLQALRDLSSFVQDELQVSRLTRVQAELLMGGAPLLVDPLTGLWTRRGITEILGRELGQSRQNQGVLAIVFIRIDNFASAEWKGPDLRENFLAEIAQRVRSCVRHSDAIGRWGEEQFVVVLPATGREGAVFTSARICTAIGERPIRFVEEAIPATVSLGAALSGGPGDGSPEALIGLAQGAAENAQRLGGNRVEVAG